MSKQGFICATKRIEIPVVHLTLTSMTLVIFQKSMSRPMNTLTWMLWDTRWGLVKGPLCYSTMVMNDMRTEPAVMSDITLILFENK